MVLWVVGGVVGGGVVVVVCVCVLGGRCVRHVSANHSEITTNYGHNNINTCVVETKTEN